MHCESEKVFIPNMSGVEIHASVKGQIIHLRALSKKLVFIDIKVLECNNSSCPAHIELVVKLGIFGEVTDVERARDTCHLGDVVQATGRFESQDTLQVHTLSNTSLWSSTSHGRHFQPDPESLAWWNATYTKRKRPAHASQQQPQQQTTSKKQHGMEGHSGQQRHTGAGSGLRQLDESSQGEQGMNSQTHGGMVPGLSQQELQPAAAPGSVKVCKFWVNTGRCARGEACLFAHVNVEAGSRKNAKRDYLDSRMAARRANAAEDGFYVHPAGDAAAKRVRASVLAQWLIDTYGKDTLNSGTGVLDVAGGRGALSWELRVVHGVKVTLVEPRPFKLYKYQHKAIKAMRKQARNAAGKAESSSADLHAVTLTDALNTPTAATAAAGQPPTTPHDSDQGHVEQQHPGNAVTARQAQHHASDNEDDDTAARAAALVPGDASVAPRPCDVVARGVEVAPGVSLVQVPAWFDEALWRAAVAHTSTSSATTDQPQCDASHHHHLTPGHTGHAAGAVIEGESVVGLKHADGVVDDERDDRAGSALCDGGKRDDTGHGVSGWSEDVLSIVSGCSVVVGLHPDQATEHILSYANETGKPFVIVPCCVFPRLYPHRRVRVLVRQGDAGNAVNHEDSIDQINSAEQRSAGGRQTGMDGAAAAVDRGMWDEPRVLMKQSHDIQLDVDDGSKGAAGGACYEEVPVTRYPQLVQYLMQQGGAGTNTQTLPFEGANKVVFRKQ